MKVRVILDTNVLLDLFEGATTQHIVLLKNAINRGVPVSVGRTGRISRSELDQVAAIARKGFLPSEIGRRFLVAAGMVPGATPRVTVVLPRQVIDEYQRVVLRHFAEQGRSSDEAERFVLESLSFLLAVSSGHVDRRSSSEEFIAQVEANCREAGRNDRDELFTWKRGNIGRVDEAAILLAVLDRDDDAVLVTADNKASARAFSRGAYALPLNELCEELEDRHAAA